jgi:hypothetical protein
MLETIFVLATACLGALFVLLYKERVTGIKHASLVRAKLDMETQNVVATMRHAWSSSLHFIEHSILLKGLHMVTYVALVTVRVMERKLMVLSQKLRTFRKDHSVLRRSTHKLTQWTEEHREGGER